jgi:hypothetical protein
MLLMGTSSASVFSLQSTIEKLLRATGRENVDQLLALMRDHGFYRVRCYKHHRYQGGLAQHSLEVLLRMQRQNEGILPTDSIIIVSLLHDLCKIDGFSHIRHHGYRSVILATREAGFKLRSEESQAILWHMHGPKEKGKLGASFDAVLGSVLWKELRKADHYSASHPLSREEIIYAMEGKHRRVVAIREDNCVGSEDYKSAPRPKDESHRIYTEEDKRRKSIKRNNATIEDVFAALREWGIDPEDAFNTVIPIYYEQQRNGNITPHPEVDNSGFRSNYLKTASPDEIEMHRTELIDRCYPVHGSAKRMAQYIYEETSGVFNCQWPTNEIYAWLKSEFGLPASRENFYKACSNFSNYTNRK